MCGTFDEEGRDPRGWIISQAFMALINSEDKKFMEDIHAGGDAKEAEWFDISLDIVGDGYDDRKSITTYELNLNGKENITAIIQEKILYKNYHKETEYSIIKSEVLTFDHAKILTFILNKLRQKLEFDLRTAFDLMPTYFTLTDLQEVFEIILNKELIKPNFRRKIADYVVETDKTIMNGGHRPSKLFMRNMGLFYK